MNVKQIVKFLLVLFCASLISVFILYYIVSEKLVQYKNEIEQKISSYTGYNVTVEDIDVGLIGVGFAIKLSNLEIKNKHSISDKNIFLGKTVKVELDIVKSIIEKKYVINRLLLSEVLADVNKQFVIDTFSKIFSPKIKEISENKVDLENFKSILIRNSNIYFYTQGKERIAFSNLNIDFIAHSKSDFFAQGSTYLDGVKFDEEIKFRAKFVGDVEDVFNADIKLDVSGTNLEVAKINSIHPLFEFDQGHISNFNLNLRWDKGEFDILNGQASIKDIVVSKDIKVNSSDVFVNYTKGELIDFSIKNVELYLPKLYKNNVYVDKIQGNINAKLKNKDIVLSSDNTKFYFNNLTVNSTYYFHKNKWNAYNYLFNVNLDAPADLQDIIAYVPEVEFPNLTLWLKGGLKTGTFVNSNFSISDSGIFNKKTKHKNNFKCAWALDYKDVMMLYADGWPQLLLDSGKLSIVNKKLNITVGKSAIIAEKIDNLTANMKDIASETSPLIIQGKIKNTTLDKGMSFINNSPLKSSFGAPLNLLAPKGKMDLDLELRIFFKKNSVEVKPTGKINISKANLYYKPLDINIENLDGEFDFSDVNFKSSNITCKVFAKDANASVNYLTNEDVLKISLASSIDALFLKKRFLTGKLADGIKGETNYSSKISIPLNGMFKEKKDETVNSKINNVSGKYLEKSSSKNGIKIDISSNLKGIELNYPKPFYKHKNKMQNFSLVLNILDNISVDLKANNLASAKILLANNRIKKGYINLGKQTKADFPGEDVFLIGGEIAKVDVSEWLDFFDFQQINNSDLNLNLNIFAQKLNIFDNNYNAVWLRFDNSKHSVELDGPKINGKFSYLTQDDKKIINLDFKYLYLSYGESKSSVLSNVKEFDLPIIVFDAQLFAVNNIDVGHTTIRFVPINSGYDLPSIKVKSPHYEFDGFGIWNVKEHNSSLKGKIKTSNLGKLLSIFSFGSTISKGSGDIDINFNWPKSPLDYNLEKIVGNMSFKVTDGHIMGVDPGIGKILGLLNLDSIKRRLKLDFSDVFNEGFAFDTFEGQIKFNENIANIENLSIAGPSANIELFGSTTIKDKTLDLNMYVTPKIGVGLPAAAAITAAGANPLVGVAFWFFDNVMISPKITNIITQHQYKVVGTWQEPNIKELGEIVLNPKNEKNNQKRNK